MSRRDTIYRTDALSGTNGYLGIRTDKPLGDKPRSGVYRALLAASNEGTVLAQRSPRQLWEACGGKGCAAVNADSTGLRVRRMGSL